MARLQAAATELVDLPWHKLSIDDAEAVIAGVESVQRTLSSLSGQAIARRHYDLQARLYLHALNECLKIPI